MGFPESPEPKCNIDATRFSIFVFVDFCGLIFAFCEFFLGLGNRFDKDKFEREPVVPVESLWGLGPDPVEKIKLLESKPKSQLTRKSASRDQTKRSSSDDRDRLLIEPGRTYTHVMPDLTRHVGVPEVQTFLRGV